MSIALCNTRRMSSVQAQPIPGAPQWDQADKMRKALRHADVSVQEIADYLGVARNTVSTWINGHIEPSTQTLRLWSIRTGVPYEWLMDTTLPVQVAPSRGRRKLPRLDSNQQPSVSLEPQVNGTVTEVDFTTRTARKHRLRPAAGPAQVIPLRPELAKTG
jgi:transcriptional regulator with XRE-family HTH domain